MVLRCILSVIVHLPGFKLWPGPIQVGCCCCMSFSWNRNCWQIFFSPFSLSLCSVYESECSWEVSGPPQLPRRKTSRAVQEQCLEILAWIWIDQFWNGLCIQGRLSVCRRFMHNLWRRKRKKKNLHLLPLKVAIVVMLCVCVCVCVCVCLCVGVTGE